MSFLTDAAKYYKAEPHQVAAWEALEALHLLPPPLIIAGTASTPAA